jgi:hypothetical protein
MDKSFVYFVGWTMLILVIGYMQGWRGGRKHERLHGIPIGHIAYEYYRKATDRALMWHGKFAIVKAENNALRRKVAHSAGSVKWEDANGKGI